jgi:hypothetical protein
VGALPDEVPLELGQRSENMKDQLAAAGGGVDLLLQGSEANPRSQGLGKVVMQVDGPR